MNLPLFKPIELEMTQAVLFVTPWVKSLESHLVSPRVHTTVEWVEDDNGDKYQVSTRHVNREPLYSVTVNTQGEEVGIVYPGLFTRTKNWLTKQKYSFTVKWSVPEIPPPDWTRLNAKQWRTGQKEMLAVMATEWRAMIEGPPGLGKTFAMEQFCRMYPQSKIIIATARAAVRDEIYERVIASDPDRKAQIVKSGETIKPWTTLLVLADKSLHRIDSDWPDIVIYDEAHNAGRKNTCVLLDKFLHCRMYGLSATPTGRHDGSDLQTQAILGEVKLRIPYHVAEKSKDVAPIHVKVFSVRQDDTYVYNINYKDHDCITANRYRNTLIGKVVRGIVPENEQVLILVNHAEHAYLLRKHIPGAVLVHRALSGTVYRRLSKKGLITPEDPQKPDVSEITKKFRSGEIKRVIATRMWQEGVDFPNLWYLVRADGLASAIGSIQMGGRLSRVTGEEKEGTLITFSDEHDGFENRLKTQLREYRKRKWKITYEEVPTRMLW